MSKPPDAADHDLEPLIMTADNDRIEIRIDSAGEWRWHRKAANGEVISQGEGYVTWSGALEGARRANPDVDGARIVEKG